MNVPTGYTALDMIGFTDKGVYNSATAYVKNDIVHYNGNLWKCLVDDTTAVTPAEGASWTVFLAEPTSAAEDIIATVEPSVVSTHQYTAGKQLILNDILYTVTAAVNIGDTLAVGTNIVASDTIVEQLTTKANTSSLATVATSGSYADLSNKPTLGTAAAKDVPASGNASTTEVVMGDDTRLSNDRNAADVYPWAKAANKPIYNGSEINTSAAQTGTAQSAVAATIASGTSMDAAIGDLLDNDVTINTDIGNVKQALSNEVATRATLGAHNLAVGEFSVYSSYGVTFTPQADGSVIAYSANAPSDAVACSSSVFTLKAGSYVLGKNLGERENVQLLKASDNSSIAFANLGNDVPFTLNADTEVKIVLYAYSGHGAYNNVVYKPFIRLASDAITEWSSPVPTNAQLLSYKDNGVLGAKNLLPNNATTQVIGGTLTVTVGADGTITLNGTVPNTNTFIDIYNGISNILETGKSYIISGSPSGLAEADGYLFINGSPEISSKAGNERTFVFDGLSTRTKVSIVLKANISVSNLVFKPMIRLASDSDSTYQPYAMTNRELTDLATTIATNEKTATSTNATYKYKEYTYGRVHQVYVEITPTATTDVSNIEEVTLNLEHKPLVDSVAAMTSLTASASDRSVKTMAFISSAGKLNIWGAMTSGRGGRVIFTYIF